MTYLGLDTIRAQQDLDVLEGGACKMLVHHWLVHLLHQLQVENMEVWLLQVAHKNILFCSDVGYGPAMQELQKPESDTL